MNTRALAVWSALCLPVTLAAPALSGNLDLLETRLQDDPAGIEAIALYPEPVRDAILEATTEPALIVKLAMLQAASSAAFEELLADYPRHTQEAAWDLVRFPGLVDRLVDGGPKTQQQLAGIAADFPPEIGPTVLEYGRVETDLLARVQELREESEAGYRELLDGHPKAVRESFGRLLHHPEVLAILSQDMSLTILLGEAYKASPRQVRERAADLNLELARQHAEALAEPPSEGTTTPVYRGEYADVARTYAQRYAYEDSGLEGPDRGGNNEVRVTYHTYPYPYWYGYPRWYAPPVWGASLGWYITPGVRASIGFYPHAYYRLAAPRYHSTVWARKRAAPRRTGRGERLRR